MPISEKVPWQNVILLHGDGDEFDEPFEALRRRA